MGAAPTRGPALDSVEREFCRRALGRIILVITLALQASGGEGNLGALGRASPCRWCSRAQDMQDTVLRLRGAGQNELPAPQTVRLVAVTCPDKALALTNHVLLNPADLMRFFASQSARFVQLNGFMLTASASDAVAEGHIALNSAQRKSLKVSSGEEIQAALPVALPPTRIHAASLELAVDFAGRATANEVLPADVVSKHVLRVFNGQVLTVGQHVVCEIRGLNLLLTVKSVLTFKEQPPEGASAGSDEVRKLWSGGQVMRTGLMGLLGPACQVSVVAVKGSILKISSGISSGPGGGAAQRGSQLFSPNFSLEDLGIGGLDAQVGDIFRRAFASRVYSTAVLQQMGIKHARGVLLHGPPGCGKTLIARKIGKLLTDTEPKVVNGPEVLSKFVGQSEENVRALFAEARAEQDEKGDDSSLHVIIFDEIDALCKQRGSNSGDAGVGDSVVNQLLSYIDGVHAIDNVLIIGMTNRFDLLDSALLRSGRLEVHVEVGLPDAAGRQQIARIHTAGMQQGGHLTPDVTPCRIAEHTPNYAGAEIEGVCRAAASYAFDRNIKVNHGHLTAASSEDLKIEWADFEQALAEVRPAMGMDSSELQRCFEGGLFDYSFRHQQHVRVAKTFIDQIKHGSSLGVRVLSLLFMGAPGTGTTALAAYVAQQSQMPYVKLLSAASLLGMDESRRARKISEVFEGAYKSSHSVIILDGLEHLLAWSRLGPSFSIDVLQTLRVLMKQPPPSPRRILVMATSSNSDALQELELMQLFDSVLELEELDEDEAIRVLEESQQLPAELLPNVRQMLQGHTIPIKKLLIAVDLAKEGRQSASASSLRSSFLACGVQTNDGTV